MTKAIIFDFYGVICPDLYLSWQRRQQVGPADAPAYQAITDRVDKGGYSAKQFFHLISHHAGVEAAEIKHVFEQHTSIDLELMDYIGQLHQSYRTGLLSNSISSMLRDILHANKLEPYFDEIVVSGEVGYIKPQPEIFEIVLSRLSVTPSEAVFIDDRPRHVAAGLKLGLPSIRYESLSKLRRELERIHVS